ncbi:SDR family NAD(P)-dependent oxidoreductase [Demequina phytophila]|uniref:SDR family NAD(P)-dependent oxidoreductase n=1 Tax=Demequina phytophila TaxID=1638981 RepID=UPI0007817C97|nr:SDR family NAD(P)-dependent oxidoreductase [Demequina phytophila]
MSTTAHPAASPILAPGRWALITGASSGLGAELAAQLASRGLHVALVARRADRLEELAARLRADHGVDAFVLAEDLSRRGAAIAVHTAMTGAGIAVDVLVNNAGLGTSGDVIDTDPARIDDLLQVNIAALTGLSRLFAADMAAAGAGAILNIASVAAAIPAPHMAVYSASKAYVASFSQALAVELEGTGVRVVTALPGTTATEFAEAGGRIPGPASMHARAADVAASFLAAVDRERAPLVATHGRADAAMAALLPKLPRRPVLRLIELAMRAR